MPLHQVRSEKPSIPSARKPLFVCILLSILMIAPALMQAQEPIFPSPSVTGILGKKDANAVAEIKAHLMAALAAEWKDLEATGTLNYPNGDAHSAHLYLMGGKNARLDIEMASGTRSLRISGCTGQYQDEEGNNGTLPPETSSV